MKSSEKVIATGRDFGKFPNGEGTVYLVGSSNNLIELNETEYKCWQLLKKCRYLKDWKNRCLENDCIGTEEINNLQKTFEDCDLMAPWGVEYFQKEDLRKFSISRNGFEFGYHSENRFFVKDKSNIRLKGVALTENEYKVWACATGESDITKISSYLSKMFGICEIEAQELVKEFVPPLIEKNLLTFELKEKREEPVFYKHELHFDSLTENTEIVPIGNGVGLAGFENQKPIFGIFSQRNVIQTNKEDYQTYNRFYFIRSIGEFKHALGCSVEEATNKVKEQIEKGTLYLWTEDVNFTLWKKGIGRGTKDGGTYTIANMEAGGDVSLPLIPYLIWMASNGKTVDEIILSIVSELNIKVEDVKEYLFQWVPVMLRKNLMSLDGERA